MGKDKLLVAGAAALGLGTVAIVQEANAQSPAMDALTASGLMLEQESQFEPTPVLINVEGNTYQLTEVNANVQRTVDRAMEIYEQNFAVRGTTFNREGLFSSIGG